MSVALYNEARRLTRPRPSQGTSTPRETEPEKQTDSETETGFDAEPGAKRTELADVTERERQYGDQPLITLTSSYLKAKDNLGKFDDYALVLRRLVDKDGDAKTTTLEIRSPILRDALKQALADYTSLTLQTCPILIQKPYNPLFHYRHEIRQYAKAPERTAEEKPHLDLLLTFMQANLAATERLYDQLVPNGLITFELLWALFRVEDVIIHQTDYYRQAYRVLSCDKITRDNDTVFEIKAWRWGYNGTRFGPSPETVIIPHFPGQRRIRDLDVYPLQILPDEECQLLQSEFTKRGRKWKSLVDVSLGEYDGRTAKRDTTLTFCLHDVL